MLTQLNARDRRHVVSAHVTEHLMMDLVLELTIDLRTFVYVSLPQDPRRQDIYRDANHDGAYMTISLGKKRFREGGNNLPHPVHVRRRNRSGYGNTSNHVQEKTPHAGNHIYRCSPFAQVQVAFREYRSPSSPRENSLWYDIGSHHENDVRTDHGCERSRRPQKD